MMPYDENGEWRSLVRSDDPDTSVSAAQSVKADDDRAIMRRLFSDGRARTAREAAVEAAGDGAPINRIESLRRRCSDLVARGELIRLSVKRNREYVLRSSR